MALGFLQLAETAAEVDLTLVIEILVRKNQYREILECILDFFERRVIALISPKVCAEAGKQTARNVRRTQKVLNIRIIYPPCEVSDTIWSVGFLPTEAFVDKRYR
jgi:hypothetical protein